MKITKTNYEDNLWLILDSIKKAELIGLDLEFTGLYLNHDTGFHKYDTLDERYRKMKAITNEFWMCQLGICTFHYSEETQRYIARPFTIYTVPYSDSRNLSVSVDSMRFLVENGFDMNLLFKEGITCCRMNEIDIENYEDWGGKSRESKRISNEHREMMEGYTQQIIGFINGNEKELNLNMPSEYVKKMFYGPLGVVNNFRGVEFSTNTKNAQIWINVKRQKSRQAVYCPPVVEQEEADSKNVKIMSFLGVTQVFAAILHKKVPLIMHNPYFDITYLYNHFIGPLPDTFLQFKRDIFNLFPVIYDTKYFIRHFFSREKFISKTKLESLYRYCYERKQLKDLVKVNFDDSFIDYLGEGKEHEAGYDAYMTGVVFLFYSKYAAKNAGREMWDIVRDAKNKICLFQHKATFIDFEYLEEEDMDVFMDNVLKLASSNKATAEQVAKEMAAFGDVEVTMVANQEYFVSFDHINDGFSLDSIIDTLNQTSHYKAGNFCMRNQIKPN
ncbi:unnamed protein product [Blepharisma stoltei]|uniref:Uncharacterized protein n=1 Tax=Blepharisma stoltei TaxID=1481888 RepID=A0AAU9K593_9CILI|nr:unnamed protein product [Blepharisma stoltei]